MSASKPKRKLSETLSTTTATTPAATPAESKQNDAVSASLARLKSQKPAVQTRVKRVRTTNGAGAFSSTGSGCLDLFFTGMVRETTKDRIDELMFAAWAEDPLLCVKIVLHARDCRGGKAEKMVAFHALEFLRRYKPATYLLNLKKGFLNVGCYKDLLTLTTMAEQGQQHKLGASDFVELEVLAEDLKQDDALVQAHQAKVRQQQKASDDMQVDKSESSASSAAAVVPASPPSRKRTADRGTRKAKKQKPSLTVQINTGDSDDDEKKEKAERKVTLSSTDKELLERVSISLAAKWAPSARKSFDKKKKGRLAKRMARLCFPTSTTPDKDYRKLLTRLRVHIGVLERLLCSGQWDDINFKAVPSRAHHLYKKAFGRHQSERYSEYIQQVQKGKVVMHTGGVQPHELVSTYLSSHSGQDATVEAQWTTMVQRLKDAGTLKNALAVCDVSGSMAGVPINVAVALSLIVAEVNSGAFHNRVVSFSTDPTWHITSQDNLYSKVGALCRTAWEMSTDLMAVFKLILTLAKDKNVPAQDMPSTLFIFSDMQFNQCMVNSDATAMESIRKEYQQAGYPLPSIVFWNLAGNSTSVPVTVNEYGVALVSGFSQELLKTFMEGQEMSPMRILRAMVDKYEAHIAEEEK